MARIEKDVSKYTKKELVEKLNEQQEKLNKAINTLIDYASKGFNRRPASECLKDIGVQKIIYTHSLN